MRWPTPRPARTAASRTRPSSRPASACASSPRSSRSSPAISRPSMPESAGMFGDGKAAMDLMGQWLLGMQAPNSASGKGLAAGGHRHPVLPDRSRRQGQGDRHARRHQRLARHQDRAARGGRFPQVLQPGEIRQGRRRDRPPTSRSSRARRPRFTDPLVKRLAADLAKTTYHQNFFDQDLGPSVGRVINDISVAVAAGEMTPEAAAAAIQDAADQQ